MRTSSHRQVSVGDAVFIGWMKNSAGKIVFPLYNITVESHPSFGSTVSDKELRRLKLRVPETPAEAEVPSASGTID